MDQLQTRLDALEQRTHIVERQLRWWRGLARGLLALAVLTWALPVGMAQEEDAPGGWKGLPQRVAALESLLRHFSRQGNEVIIKGANLRLVNGLGETETTNNLGNLIVGYNELRQEGSCPGEIPCINTRTGSHNVVVGKEHNFSSFGGLVIGLRNEISGAFASVSGGNDNTASGLFASISGGQLNTASGTWASISGGEVNTASGSRSSISGGAVNFALGDACSVSGGNANTAAGSAGWAAGGYSNLANGIATSVLGGTSNRATGEDAVVTGGRANLASGLDSVVSGGLERTAAGALDWVAGSLFEDD